MKTIELKVNYGGQDVDINIVPEENCSGTLYPVEANGKYVFTFLENQDGDWSLMRENDAKIPDVENVFYDTILRKLHYELMYVV